jgi:hypothetical protein
MTGLPIAHWALAGSNAAALHVLTMPWGVIAVAATALYRLSAERERRRTLIELVTYAPANTVVVMEKGPGGPAVWVRVGDGEPPAARGEVLRARHRSDTGTL